MNKSFSRLPKLPVHCRTAVVCLLTVVLSPHAASASNIGFSSVVSVYPQNVHIAGDDAPVQLVVSERTVDGMVVERTGAAQFRSLSDSVIDVSVQGRITPVGNGQGTIEVTLDGRIARVTVNVFDFGTAPIPDFETGIQPILATLGCSTGACHGKQGGQNGFQLSLLGFDSDFDYAAITKQARGRRVFPAAPENSLLLRKAAAEVPHGGGQRFSSRDSHYQSLLNWIRNGSPRQGDNPLQLEQIIVEPPELIMSPNTKHRLVVTATFSDGSRRDVTGLTAFSSNESVIAAVDKQALVAAGPIAGEAAIMARFMGRIATCRILLPRSEAIAPGVYEQLPRNNFVDDLVWQKLARLNIVPSRPTSDTTYLRRVYVDIIGRQPTSDVVREFLADDTPSKRVRLVDQLLEHPGYADHWANKWVDLLRPNPYRVGIKAVMSFDNWIRQAFRENRPYDQFVRQLLTAQGSTWHNGASTLFRDRRSPDELTTIVSQLFLGVRLECAKCHHHPFEVWGQDDFYSFAAHFARVGRKGSGLSPPISGGEEIVFTADSGTVTQPRTGQTVLPRTLGGPPLELPKGQDPRSSLVDWMTADDNPYFSKVIANRIWAELMGKGLVDPVDKSLQIGRAHV